MRCSLPWPPTSNNYRMPVRGRLILTREGRDYQAAAALALLEQRVPKDLSSARWSLSLVMHPPDRRKRDLSNFVKQPEDALMAFGALADDSQIDRLTVERGAVVPSGRVVVVLERIPSSEKQPG